mmetsp:Transcript_2711/g.3673  ORF Transcript_2711/g.3673 Transcript_2711/m.3673 type:complete len:260 (+) Transcript_2711:3-782(+)
MRRRFSSISMKDIEVLSLAGWDWRDNVPIRSLSNNQDKMLASSSARLLDKHFKGGWNLKVGAATADQFPSNGLRSKGLYPEIAFVGRSNVGKSTLINALVSQKLAHTSKTPGRTQQINFFYRKPYEQRYIVDLPGYGFAKAPVKVVEEWNVLIGAYTRMREALVRMFVLIDNRRGLTTNDKEFLDFLEELRIPHQILVTKVDRTRLFDLETCMNGISAHLHDSKAVYTERILHPVSAKTGHGVPALRELALSLLSDILR